MSNPRASRLADTRGRPTARARELTDGIVRLALDRGLESTDQTELINSLLALYSLRDACSRDFLKGPLPALKRQEKALTAWLRAHGVRPASGIVPELSRLAELQRKVATRWNCPGPITS